MNPGLASTVLDKTLDSARRGRYSSALDELAELGGRESNDPRVLDLVARVHAQRGELADADSCWARALDLDPGWEQAIAGRRRIAELQAGRYRYAVMPVVCVLVASAVVAGTVIVVGELR
jgi:predicted Zn-dependent protease